MSAAENDATATDQTVQSPSVLPDNRTGSTPGRFADGSTSRIAVDARPTLIVFLAVWLTLIPAALTGMFMLIVGLVWLALAIRHLEFVELIGSLFIAGVALIVCLTSSRLVFAVTRDYLFGVPAPKPEWPDTLRPPIDPATGQFLIQSGPQVCPCCISLMPERDGVCPICGWKGDDPTSD